MLISGCLTHSHLRTLLCHIRHMTGSGREHLGGLGGYCCCVYGPAVFLSTELSGSVLYPASTSCVCAHARTCCTRLLSIRGLPLFSHWGPLILTKAPSSICSSAGLVSLVCMKTWCNPQSQRCPPVFSWGGLRASVLHSEVRTCRSLFIFSPQSTDRFPYR